jgi:outer membrane protein assembly factor BamB
MNIRHSFRVVLGIGLGLLASAASGDCEGTGSWPKFRSNASNNGLASDSTLQGQIRWSFNTGGLVWSSPAVDSSGIYVGSSSHKFYSLDKSGHLRWSFQTGDEITSSPAIDSGVVYFGSNDHKVYALDAASGAKKWEFATGDQVTSSPSVGSNIYIGSMDHKVYAIDPASGHKTWDFQTGGPVDSSPAISPSGVLVIGSNDHKIYGLDPTHGNKIWEYTTGAPIHAAPAVGVTDSAVYVGSDDHKLYALNVDTGALLWTFDTGGVGFDSAAVIFKAAGDTLYFGSNGGFYAIDVPSRQLLWRNTDWAGWGYRSSPAVARGTNTLYVGSYKEADRSNFLIAADTATGSAKWSIYITGFLSSPAVDGDGILYVGSLDGNLYAVQ